jgi:hypothetical protein
VIKSKLHLFVGGVVVLGALYGIVVWYRKRSLAASVSTIA